ncbi:MAG: 3'(2'),5'-bisphosphate nucleotidase CysQ [candidate division KSB1 bacterium]|nr:3'(2'),5'-bisphosphate nucleotidase CysQ [candidate division KSB1 bacterium]MDZ7302583.1 3'(2'),5'-bisphosphate nucleotidase CysQ [candidate division KSB1 bacterium]MDZ7311576.1 3'(2'),5'-bisphosphate nucleotidase CysQ [candidate division KSB1 bacterium]
MQSSELDCRLQIVRDIVRAAGDAVLQYYDKTVAVAWKAPDDPVTAADHAANALILEQLYRHFPGEPVLAEESEDDMSRLGHNVIWMVDPLDGTKEFLKHNGEFSVMVGLVEHGRPVLGAVMQPAPPSGIKPGALYSGAIGLGAWLSLGSSERPIRVTNVDQLSHMRMVASRSHFDPRVDQLRKRLGIHKILHHGSVGLKCGMIATGACELYIHPSSRVSLWDSCAPAAILMAAGGMMTDLLGQPLTYTAVEIHHRQGLLASNGRLHDKVVAMIQEAGLAAEA